MILHVHLVKIIDDLSLSLLACPRPPSSRIYAGNVSFTGSDAQTAMDMHIGSGRGDRIHRHTSSFVTETFAITSQTT